MKTDFNYNVVVKTTNETAHFIDVDMKGGRYEKSGVSLTMIRRADAEVGVRVETSDKQNRIKTVSHRIVIGLRNFNKVIIPDSGRSISNNFEPILFWGFDRQSLVKNICTPLFIFTGQDNMTAFAFGVVGSPLESRFRCVKPFRARALSAYPRELELEIRRGTEEFSVPEERLQTDDTGTKFEEILYLRDYPAGSNLPWPMTLRDFAKLEKRSFAIEFPRNEAAREPLWCSWTDWHSDDVNEELILRQVEAGVMLGIKNYIIDDGWFGPGLDSDYEVELNIGDWNPDPAKIKDVRQLSRAIRERGGRSLIWCAPHAVGTKAECFRKRLPYLSRDADGSLLTTSNIFHVLCICSPEARRIMAEICVRLAVEYETDGAKYDLFNCIPDEPCCSEEHEHDTASPIVGLEKLLALIWQRLREVNPDYMVELKQNYGGVFLAQYGTMMRAGDTPYSPEGNFIRTAYIQGYTSYAMNDYMSITDNDSPRFSASIVIRMLAVGIPTYSMDICRLPEEHKGTLRFYHNWYLQRRALFDNHREPVDAELNVWKIQDTDEIVYFLLNTAVSVEIEAVGAATIVNATGNRRILIRVEGGGNVMFKLLDHTGRIVGGQAKDLSAYTPVDIPVGGMLVMGDT